MRDVLAIWHLELERTWQSRALLALFLVTPFAWLFFFGLAFQEGLGLEVEGVGYLAFLAPGLMALMSLWALQNGITVGHDREVGFLREVLVAPVGRASIVAGRALGAATVSAMQAAVTLGITALLGASLALPLGAAGLAGALGTMLLLSMGFTGLGMTLALRSRSPQAVQAATALLTLPMFFLGGSLQPVDTLPSYLQPFAYVNPLAYGVDAMRFFLLGEGAATFPLALAAGVLAAFAAAMLALGGRALRNP